MKRCKVTTKRHKTTIERDAKDFKETQNKYKEIQISHHLCLFQAGSQVEEQWGHFLIICPLL